MNSITLTNGKLEISNPSAEVSAFIKSSLIYTDKSKKYQLRRMARNPWQRASALYAKLQLEVEGVLYEENGGLLSLPSGFFPLFQSQFPVLPFEDKRVASGKKIVVPWVNKPHDLRPYQEEGIALILGQHHRGILNFAMGLGKTLTAIHTVQRFKKNTLIICPSDSIAKQFYDQCIDAFGKNKVGFFGGGKKQINEITIGIAASVTRNVELFAKADFGLIIFDEIHHIAADTFFKIAQGLSAAEKIFGLTATDYRSDGKDIMITAACGPVLIRREIKWGVENKFLAEPYFIVREVDTGGKDFKDNKLKNYKEHVLNNQKMKDQIFNDAQKMINIGKSVLVLVDEIAHGEELAKQLGVPFAKGTDADSQNYITLLNRGKIPGLVGTSGKVGEGSDTKNVDVLILADFTASKGPVIQAVGRGLRRQGTKTKCLILDYIPSGSQQLTRHAWGRVAFYREISDHVKVVSL